VAAVVPLHKPDPAAAKFIVWQRIFYKKKTDYQGAYQHII